MPQAKNHRDTTTTPCQKAPANDPLRMAPGRLPIEGGEESILKLLRSKRFAGRLALEEFLGALNEESKRW